MIFAVLDLWVWHISPLHGLYKLAKFFTLIFAVLLPNVTRHFMPLTYIMQKKAIHSLFWVHQSSFIKLMRHSPLGPEEEEVYLQTTAQRNWNKILQNRIKGISNTISMGNFIDISNTLNYVLVFSFFFIYRHRMKF